MLSTPKSLTVQDAVLSMTAQPSSSTAALDKSFMKNVRSARRRPQNWDIDHACVDESLFIFRQLFDFAKDHRDLPVNILTGTGSPKFFNLLADEVKALMDGGIEVRLIILSREFEINDNEFAKTVAKHNIGHLYQPVEEVPSMKGFVVIGDVAYRFQIRRDEAKYVVNFNNDMVGKFLKSTFNNILQNCREINFLNS